MPYKWVDKQGGMQTLYLIFGNRSRGRNLSMWFYGGKHPVHRRNIVFRSHVSKMLGLGCHLIRM